MSAILVLVCVFNGSYLVVFITRFTEELFASFIAVIFIISAFQKIYRIGVKFPLYPATTVSAPNHAVNLAQGADGRGWECTWGPPDQRWEKS